jgi:hypothetical protein
MAPRYRHSLPEKLALHAPAFRMSDVTFKSFQLQARHAATLHHFPLAAYVYVPFLLHGLSALCC